MKKSFLLILGVLIIGVLYAQQNPSFEDVLSLKNVSNIQISPDGKHVLFQKSSTDWKENRYDTEIWMSKNGGMPFQLTNNIKGSSTSPQWSPDGKWIAFLSNRTDKNQIQVMRADGGEAMQLTHTEGNVGSYEWSPKGDKIAFLQAEDKSKEDEKRKKKYGAFEVEDNEFSLNHLWIQDFKPSEFDMNITPQQLEDSTFKAERKPVQLMEEAEFSIGRFQWSPDGTKIAFSHQPDPLINSFFHSDISVYDFATQSYKILVANPSADGLEGWSPDSKSILYSSDLENTTSNYYLNGHLFRINLDGSNNMELAKDFDEQIGALNWIESGIYATAWQKTNRKMLKINPKNGKTSVVELGVDRVVGYDFSKDGNVLAWYGENSDDLREVYISDFPKIQARKITEMSSQIKGWSVSDAEVISWKSKDGATIEGILHKPKDYDASKKYPLMVIIHGGPTGISVPTSVVSYVYPVTQWLNKGALVLQPNYRGSAGYGEAFRSLNVENLGVGDAWDVISGVEYLEEKGIIDAGKVASMGWSQGGYISAFLTTNSDKFQAISVGAGISNWMTYYVNTDIHPFTRQYLKSTPWSNKEIYEKTSPMTNINKAKTPTLIQHGEFDRRVPVANAYELYQGLQDVGVETKLIIYKGFGHGITKPKERLAATVHNWEWFGKYIWGEEDEE